MLTDEQPEPHLTPREEVATVHGTVTIDNRRLAWGSILILLVSAGCGGRSFQPHTMKWVQVETANLVIRTDLGRQKAVALANGYQRLRDAIAENEFRCAFSKEMPPLEIVIVKKNSHADLVLGQNVAGTYIGPPTDLLGLHGLAVLRGSATESDTRTFVHEMAHQLISACIPSAQPWLSEGAASFYETARIEGNQLLLGIRPYGFVKAGSNSVQVIEREGTRVHVLPTRLAPPFDELRRMDPAQFYLLGEEHSLEVVKRRAAHYAGAWLAVHLLQFSDPELARAFSKYLGALSQGIDDDQAWELAFSGADIESLYQQYLVAAHIVGTRQISARPLAEPNVAPLPPEEVALLWARMISWGTEAGRSTALQYIDRALAEAPGASDPMLYYAALSERSGDLDETAEWLDSALQTAPEDPDVLAACLFWRLRRNDIPSPGTNQLAELAGRLGASPSTAFHYTVLAAYAMRSADPQEALELARTALSLDATFWSTHLLLAQAYRALGRRGEAKRAFLIALSLTAHASSDAREWLRDQIASLREE